MSTAPDEGFLGAGSVLIAIRAHEQKLAERIEQAKKEAEQRIAAAMVEAGELAARAARDLEVELEKEAALARRRAAEEGEERRRAASANIEAMRGQARQRARAAVDAMLAIVLPEEEG